MSEHSIPSRVTDLLARMTPAEKVGQLVQVPTTQSELATLDAWIAKGGVGSICLALGGLAGNAPSPMPSPAELNRWQRIAVEGTRLGIPLLLGRDVIHGFRTIFPIPLGQATGWHPEALAACCRQAAKEARSCGVHWTWAPMLDLVRDPRWGRCAESFGEDPFLIATLGAAAVRGFQGDPDGSDLDSNEFVAACAKHYIGYGAATGGRDCNTTEITRTSLLNTYLPPFEAAIHAGCRTVMSGYQDLDGEPVSSSRYLLSDLLRDQLGFEGFVVSDYNCISDLIVHRTAANRREATRQAMAAGIDMDMSSRCYSEHLEDCVTNGHISDERLDEAVGRVLWLKMELGLFERPYVEAAGALDESVPEVGYTLARRAAIEGTVLLKNEGELLPLTEDKRIIGLTGMLARDSRALLGTWMLDGRPERTETIAECFERRVPKERRVSALSGLSDRDLDDCAAVDVVVAILGEDQRRSGEAHSVADIGLPLGQLDTLRHLARLGKPVVAVVYAGRPLVLTEVCKNCQALLWIPHSGTAAADALWDVLLGAQEPLGRLPVTLPRHAGQVPIYYNANSTAKRGPLAKAETISDLDVRAYGYQDLPTGPLFPFGFGMGYTAWRVGQVAMASERCSENQLPRVYATVTNTGRRAGQTVVQLYLQDCCASITRPLRELKAFQRVSMEAGASESIVFDLDTQALSFYRRDGRRCLEPGRFLVWVGFDSHATESTAFEWVSA